ncbi:hypothetical protein [Staphylococcus epidermidis]|uniref:hypothetical protein n=1 Tax=Staphylococcus epidermidis TaxID=1282 RepID=UPI002739B970|nr:hypothetical protein [Staphylococcus epidermidis]HBI1179742.1 hypothetical protein [Staphylococcus aureus]HDH9883940.1 hypothetical protein [Staphylococcus aureus]
MDKRKANLLLDRISNLNYQLMKLEKLSEDINKNENEMSQILQDMTAYNFDILYEVWDLKVETNYPD